MIAFGVSRHCRRTLLQECQEAKSNEEAIAFLKSEMVKAGADVRTDSVNVPLWLPGVSSLYYMDETGRKELNAILWGCL